MKNIQFALIIIFALLITGSCEDDLGLLSDDPRDAFVGDWSVKEENSIKSTEYYNVSIEKSASDSALVQIKNFYEIGNDASVEAVVSGGSVTIRDQTVSGFTIQGSGDIAINDKSIDWTYTVNHNNGFTDHVTATYTKID